MHMCMWFRPRRNVRRGQLRFGYPSSHLGSYTRGTCHTHGVLLKPWPSSGPSRSIDPDLFRFTTTGRERLWAWLAGEAARLSLGHPLDDWVIARHARGVRGGLDHRRREQDRARRPAPPSCWRAGTGVAGRRRDNEPSWPRLRPLAGWHRTRCRPRRHRPAQAEQRRRQPTVVRVGRSGPRPSVVHSRSPRAPRRRLPLRRLAGRRPARLGAGRANARQPASVTPAARARRSGSFRGGEPVPDGRGRGQGMERAAARLQWADRPSPS